MPASLVWLRRDLRLSDHTALAEACAEGGPVAVAFVFDTTILDSLADKKDRRVTFIHDSLVALDADLRARGSMLIVRHGDPRQEIPLLASALGVRAVHASRDYEPSAIARDLAVERSLHSAGIDFRLWKDQVVFENREILNGSGDPFRVFTPYKNAWLRALTSPDHPPMMLVRERHADLSLLAPVESLATHSVSWDLNDLGFSRCEDGPQAGEAAAQFRLRTFLPKLSAYHEQRNFPAANGTSGLSVDLRFGTISIRALMRAALEVPDEGSSTWISELIWRDFYAMILATHPHVAREAFRPEFASLEWPGLDAHFTAWTEGRTGYPIVDAAMRELRTTGRMHNRLRMITAMFLTKDLLIDWRRGEAWFAARLLDYDLASNNGGWQWCAGTGSDAQPWFRIFNPVLQSRRFDPEGEYIRSWIPELRYCPGASIHWPHGTDLVPDVYPSPIVDHAVQRLRTLDGFRNAASGKMK